MTETRATTETPNTDEMKASYPQNVFQAEPGSCQIVLVRHGQSEAFVEGKPFDLVAGHGDPPLSSLGHWQAERVGERLSSEPIDAIYVSSLTRTHQTAAPLANELGQSPIPDDRFREVFLGDFEGGLFRQKAAENHPAIAAFRQDQEWSRIPGAESNVQLQNRVVAALGDVASAHPDQLVAVFCHGGVIASLLSYALGQNNFTFMGVRNASFSLLAIESAKWHIRSFNDAAHCGSLTADADPPT